MLPIIFWTLVFLAGAWALYTGLTTPQEDQVDTWNSPDTDGAEAPAGRAHRVT